MYRTNIGRIEALVFLTIAVLLSTAVTARAIILVANDDAYTAAAGQDLVVDAPGVLENDRDGNDNDLPPSASAELLGDATHGLLDLSPDGSFTYTPDDGFTGTDTFTYRVIDAPDASDPATVTLTVQGCAGGPAVFTCWVEAAFQAKLIELGFSSFQEGFENDTAWGAVRSPNTAVSVSNQGITWQANNSVSEVTTGPGPARTGSWGFYTDPHGDPGGAPFDWLRDGFIGTGADTLVGVGAWLTSNTGGAQVQFALDGNIVTFSDARVTSAHKFFGAIDTRGFTAFEIYETEGTVQDQEYIFADDVTIGSTGPIEAPDIHVTPPALFFGEVTTGVTETRMVTIANVGTIDLTVSSLSFTGSPDFALNPAAPSTPFTVAPGAFIDVPVDYSPSAVGADNGSLNIGSNDPDEATVPVSLSGTGIQNPWGIAYSRLFDSQSDLNNFREYRDSFLMNTKKGRLLTKLLYANSTAALKVLLDNPELMLQANQLVTVNKNAVSDVLNGREGVIYNTDEIVSFLNAYIRKSPIRFKILLKIVKQDMLRKQRKGKLFLGFKLKKQSKLKTVKPIIVK